MKRLIAQLNRDRQSSLKDGGGGGRGGCDKAFYAVVENTQMSVKKNYNSELKITNI